MAEAGGHSPLVISMWRGLAAPTSGTFTVSTPSVRVALTPSALTSPGGTARYSNRPVRRVLRRGTPVRSRSLNNDDTAPPVLVLVLVLWLLRRLLSRLAVGAGPIKLRGDPCRRNPTCLHYPHETRPLPGQLSWFFHHMPGPVHRVEVAANHIAQLVVPFALFTPQATTPG